MAQLVLCWFRGLQILTVQRLLLLSLCGRLFVVFVLHTISNSYMQLFKVLYHPFYRISNFLKNA